MLEQVGEKVEKNVRAWSVAFGTVRARYLVALTLVAFLSASAYVLLGRVIDAQANNAAVINTSGRQRMLSQRTALFAQELVLAQTQVQRKAARDELTAAANLMERAHLGLTNQTAPEADPADLSPALAALYFSPPLELDTQVRGYLAYVRRLLAARDAALTPQNPELQRILVTAPGRLLTSLGTAVAQYEREANQQIANLKFETGVLAVTLLTLLLEGLLIFYPLERDLARGRIGL